MSDIWPDNLVEELAYRRCLIFLGSGISATAKNDAGESPDTWGAFLNNVKLKMKNPSEDDKKFVEDMLKKQNYLLALQAIADLCDSGEYSNYLKSQYLRGKYKPSKVHELIKDLDSKIVVTTNFDKLYEGLCHEPEYLTFDYTDTRSIIGTINEQISNFAQTYPTNLKASSNEALLFMRRYRFANCSCFSCCFKDAYPSSNVQ